MHLFCNLQTRARTHAVLVVGLYELLGNPTTYPIEPPGPLITCMFTYTYLSVCIIDNVQCYIYLTNPFRACVFAVSIRDFRLGFFNVYIYFRFRSQSGNNFIVNIVQPSPVT